MARRAAILISCSKEEAAKIREAAKAERRTISGYVFNIVIRAAEFDAVLLARSAGIKKLSTLSKSVVRGPVPKTTMLLWCSPEESAQIRRAAKMRETSISGFILHSLKRCWEV